MRPSCTQIPQKTMANVISQSSGDFQQVDACSSQPEIFKGHPCTCGWSNRSQKPASVKVDLDQLEFSSGTLVVY